jgi:hypothetical protein
MASEKAHNQNQEKPLPQLLQTKLMRLEMEKNNLF